MKKKLFISILSIAMIGFLFSCAEPSEGEQATSENTHEVKPGPDSDCDGIHWSHHEGETGPENWKDLCSGFSACGGQSQSPIDIISDQTSQSDELSAINLGYETSKVEIINNGHTVQFNVTGNNTMSIGEKDYQLLQFHYHTVSEHTINGNHSPVEVHFVHKYSDSDFAVLGIMFEAGKAYELFTSYLDDFPVTEGKYTSDETINLSSIVPTDLSYFYYKGSLTTPPCSEVVNWYVLKTPLKASKEQIDKFSNILKDNYRPIMPLNGRKVLSN